MAKINSGIIYIVTSPSGKMYVGQTTTSLKNRKRKHVLDSKRHDYAFSRAILKYGASNMKWEILEDGISPLDLNRKEEYYIKKFDTFKNGYNSTEGGDFNPMDYQELRNKVSERTKNKKHNIDQCGEKNHQAKLTEVDVKEIRRIYTCSKLTYSQIAKEFNISDSTVREIVQNRLWKDDCYVVPIKNRSKNYSIKQELDIVNRFVSGICTMRELADETGLRYQVVHYIINKHIND